MKVIVAGHFRVNPKTGKREWVDTYTRHVQGGGSETVHAKTGKLRDLMDDAHVDQSPGSTSRLEAHVAVNHKSEPPVTSPESPKVPSGKATGEAVRLRSRESLLPGGKAPTKDTPGWHEVESDRRRGRGRDDDSGTRLAMTDEAWAKHYAAAEDKIIALSATDTTVQKYGVGPRMYTPERTEQQKLVINAILDQAKNTPKQKKAVFTGGLPGAGKSSSLEAQGITDRGYFTLDSDKVKEEMIRQGLAPEVDGVTPLETAALIHEESANIMDDLLERLSTQGTNLIVDGTMTWQPYVEKQNELLGLHGYTVKGLFVNTKPAVAEQRTMSRYRQGVEDFIATGKGFGGRLVQKNVSANSRAINPYNTFNAIRDVFHSWVVYDNSDDGSPKLIDSSHEDVQFAAASAESDKGGNQKVTAATERFLKGEISADDVVKLVNWKAKQPPIPTGTKLLTQDYYRYVEVPEPNSVADIARFFSQMTPEQRNQMEEAIARSGN